MMYVSRISGRIRGYMFSGLTLGLGRLWVMSRSSGHDYMFGLYFVLVLWVLLCVGVGSIPHLFHS